MHNQDLDTVVRDLNDRFAAPLPEFYRRRIIFWYDEDRDFEEKLEGFTLENAKWAVMTGKNTFQIKKLVTFDDTISNYLVYCPLTYERLEDHWMLNLERYSEVYRADLISIWMKEVNLPSTPDFRRLVKVYTKFFSKPYHRSAFAKRGTNIQMASQLHLAVMGILSESVGTRPDNILRAVLAGGLDMEKNAAYRALVTYGAEKPFWALVKQASGYDEGEDSTLAHLVTHLMLTAAARTVRRESLAGLDRFISMPHQVSCQDFISEWLHDQDNAQLLAMAQDVEDDLRLYSRFSELPAEELTETELFPCVDECILTQLMTEIRNQIIRTDVLIAAVEKRRTMAWYGRVACYYEGLLQVAKMREFFLEHAAGFHLVEPQKVWNEYTNDYYRMDGYYRQFHLAFGRSLTESNDLLDDLFKHVADYVENLYTHWFLAQLGTCWSNACAEELAKSGHLWEVSQQENFYSSCVKNAKSRVFVIISDALRYEVAASLAEQLQRETQSKVELKSMEALFPTVTKYGMAALLPHEKLTVTERSGGDLAVLADGQSTDAGNRDKVLKAGNVKSVALQYKNIVGKKRAERSALVKGMDVVYIYHDKIDEASHTSDSAVFPACGEAIAEIKNIVRMIVNEFSGTQIYITADHGFLYTRDPLSENGKVDKTTPGECDVEIDRRYLVARKGTAPGYLLPVRFMPGKESYDAFAPRENIRIKKKGGGLNYVHGGISLQEMAVPLIDYHYLRSDSETYKRNREKYDTKPVAVHLLSAGRKICNMVFSLNFYQSEPVCSNREASTYRLYFTDASGNVVSDTSKIIADRTNENEQERIFRCTFNLKPLQYKNTEPYFLVLARESDPQTPRREEFQMDIAFTVEEFQFFE